MKTLYFWFFTTLAGNFAWILSKGGLDLDGVAAGTKGLSYLVGGRELSVTCLSLMLWYLFLKSSTSI